MYAFLSASTFSTFPRTSLNKIISRRLTFQESYSLYAVKGPRSKKYRRALAIMTSAGESQSKFKIALCQIPVTPSKERNLETAREYLRNAASAGASLAVLPECFNSPYDTLSFRRYAEPIQPASTDGSLTKTSSPSVAMLSEMAIETGLHIIGGSIPEIDSSTDKVYNASVSVGPDGRILAVHRKAHLFDIDVPGKIKFTESAVLSAGNCATTFPFTPPFAKDGEDIITIGVSICYDVRFPELAAVQAQKLGARLLVFPGAFNMTTGPAHWELLLRARALDNQTFVAACSPARDLSPDASYKAWGHSMVVDPWGTVLGSAKEGPDLILVDIDMARLEYVRTSIPVRNQRRSDIYELQHVNRSE